jgi:hypothetical protein
MTFGLDFLLLNSPLNISILAQNDIPVRALSQTPRQLLATNDFCCGRNIDIQVAS